jgi:cellulose synthase/poly-beta-1,6-N-acetylglucosamine synthase-like glycosyltransferase
MSTATTQDAVILPHRVPAPEPVDGVSVVVPIHNEEENLPRLHKELTAALVALGKPYEIVLVDDGSRDGSARLMEDLAEGDPRVKLVMLRRNYGQTSGAAGRHGPGALRGDRHDRRRPPERPG